MINSHTPPRELFALVVGATVPPFNLDRCNMIEPSGGVAECDVADVFVLRRVVAGDQPTAGTLCAIYGAP